MVQEGSLWSQHPELLPDYLITDTHSQTYVLPARVAKASAQDTWLVQPRRTFTVMAELLVLAAETQSWMADGEPRNHVCC
jgi:hypothetical protein